MEILRAQMASCHNLQCVNSTIARRPSLQTCSRCRTAKYCNKECQTLHWRKHKEFCKVWVESAAANGGISVGEVKFQMLKLLWLARGIPEFTNWLFREYHHWRFERRKRGVMQFNFGTFAELSKTVRIIEEDMEVFEERLFRAMPGTPSDVYHPELGNVPRPIQLRRPKSGRVTNFQQAIKSCIFTENTRQPNLDRTIDKLGDSQDILILSVRMQLVGDYSTHMHDFIYQGLSWSPPGDGTPH